MDDSIRITQPPTPEQIAAMTTQNPQVPLMYFNYVRTASSFFDFRLFFGQGSVSPQGQPTFEEQLCVVMSVEFAKVLRESVDRAIAVYEEKFGKTREAPRLNTEAAEPTDGKKKRHS